MLDVEDHNLGDSASAPVIECVTYSEFEVAGWFWHITWLETRKIKLVR